jgi:hypothetical protein
MRSGLKWTAALLATLTLSTTALTPVTANASRYHSGMPKKFWGHWRNKSERMRIRKNGYDSALRVATGWVFVYGKPRVKALGHNKYRDRIFTYKANRWTTHSFTYISKNKIKWLGETLKRY